MRSGLVSRPRMRLMFSRRCSGLKTSNISPLRAPMDERWLSAILIHPVNGSGD
jgi:hypothetical protein